MSKQGKLAFRLRRFWGFMKLLLRNKKSLLGLFLIAFFIVLALGAPLLTPYNALGEDPKVPLFPVSSPSKAPFWFRYLPEWLGGNPELSENIIFVQNPGLLIPKEEGGEWDITVEGSGVSYYVNELYGYPIDPAPGFARFEQDGSLAVRFSRESGTSYNGTRVDISVEFDYPYLGPPGRFIGNIVLQVNGTVHQGSERMKKPPFDYVDVDYLDVPVMVNVYLGRADAKKWKVWPTPEILNLNLYSALGLAKDPDTGQPWGIDKPLSGVLVPDGWVISRESAASMGSQIDSDSNYLVNALTEFGAPSFPHKLIFGQPGRYVYGVELVFLDQGFSNVSVETTVLIDDFGLFAYGTSFGLQGTDHHGRDLYSQLIYGTRISLYIGILVAVFSVTIGLSVGLVAAYLGGAVDQLLMRFSDVLLVLPGLPLLIVLMAVLSPSIDNLMILLVLLGWMGFARLVRSQVLSIKERPFVEAAKAVGAGNFHIIINHILPSVMSLVYIALATSVPGAVTAEAALAWLGFYDPTRMSWGRMLNAAFEAKATSNWWWLVPPGMLIALLAVAFILLGYALDEVLNPKLRLRK